MKEMKIYILRDRFDGQRAVVLAESRKAAIKAIEATTTLAFEIVAEKDIAELPFPIIIKNNILPF